VELVRLATSRRPVRRRRREPGELRLRADHVHLAQRIEYGLLWRRRRRAGRTHPFSTAVETHDAIAVSDPGNAFLSPSFANSSLEAVPAPFGIAITQVGSVMRGPILQGAAAATADARDEWEFSISVPMHFAFTASLSADQLRRSDGTADLRLQRTRRRRAVQSPIGLFAERLEAE
jgi:hypothetical protein